MASGGNARREATAPTEYDRARVVNLLRAHADDGELSKRELDERLEHAYRAKSMAELDRALGGLSSGARLEAAFVMTEGLRMPQRRQKMGFMQRQLIFGTGWLVFWIIIWAVTGAGLEWLALIVVGSATGFAYRLARGERRQRGSFGRASLRR